MNDDELLRTLGKVARDDRDAPPSPDEGALEGALDGAFEDRLFAELGIAEGEPAQPVAPVAPVTPAQAPRNVIPFPPNRARSTRRVFAGFGMAFAAAAAVVLVQRGGGERLGSYELSAQSERLERGAEVEETAVTASVGRPLTLVLRPTAKTTASPEVRVTAAFGSDVRAWDAKVEVSATGSLRVTVVPATAGKGELRVRLAPKGDTNEDHARTLTRPLEVREAR
jgi:hypothetical protein